MKKKIFVTLLTISVILSTLFFLGGTPPSARGFYYVLWLSFFYFVFWRNQENWQLRLEQSTLGQPATFIGLGLLMILIEETFAGLAVNILHAPNLGALIASIPQYYANNFLILPGFIIAWYMLLQRYVYTRGEIFVLVGLFGVFAEKIYMHVLTIPILGVPLILPTMFTYFAVLFPSLLSLRSRETRALSGPVRYIVGFLFPILVSLPFLFVHALLSKAGLIDPTVLQR